MTKLAKLAFLIAVMATTLLVGCSRDPNVVKQRYFDSGSRYLQKQQYREAAIQFQNAIQVDAGFAEAHYQLAQCYLKVAAYNPAYRELTRTLELRPGDVKATINLGRLYLGGRQFPKAKDQAAAVLAKDPNNAEGHALQAGVLSATGQPESAVNEMKIAVQLQPNRPDFFVDLGYLETSAKHSQEAEDSFKTAVNLEPKSATDILVLGAFYQQQGRLPEAEAQFQRAIELAPKNPAPRNALAHLYQAEQQNDKAEQVLRDAKNAMPDVSEGYRMLADYYISIGDLDKGLTEYASLYKEHPKDVQVQKTYAAVLFQRNRIDDAAKLNDKVLKQNSNDVDALILRGEILTVRKSPNDAIAVFESAVRLEPDNPKAHLGLSAAFDLAGNGERSEAELREAVRLRPSLLEAQRVLARIALAKGDTDQVRRSAEALIQFQPNSPDGYVWRAGTRYAGKDLAGAEADLKKAIEVAPKASLGYTEMGILYLTQKRVAEAQKLFEQALDINPADVNALHSLVNIDLQQKETEKALARVEAQIAKSPKTGAYYTLEGTLFLNEKKLDQAETQLQKAADLNDADALILLGQVQTERGNADKAVADYQRLIEQNPNDARPYLILGSIEEGRGNWQQAESYYQKVLQKHPDYPPAANNLAFLMLEHGENPDVALSMAQVARRGSPDSPAVADTLGWAYYQKAAYTLAINLLQEAAKQLENDPNVHYHLGLAYQKSGNKEGAKTELQRALQINPKFVHAEDARRALAEVALGG